MIYLGTSGWYYSDWIETFYPTHLQKNQWLTYYAERFNTVEVNATFYRLPFKNMVLGWKRETPEHFVLTFKGSQIITHRKKLRNVQEHLHIFFQRIKIAEQKIGVVLWQLPPHLKKNIDLLENFCNQLPTTIKQTIEFRHNSWFDTETITLLKRYNIAFCNVSAPDLPPTTHQTADFAYFRWHGRDTWYRYQYNDQELRKWADKIQQLRQIDIYGYFNNDFEGFAIQNCLKMKKMLQP